MSSPKQEQRPDQQQRFFTFLLLAMLVFWVNSWILRKFAPPAPAPAAAANAAAVPATPPGASAINPFQLPKHDPTWVSLGSLDPQDGAVMLVTLSSQGASIEGVELNHPQLIDSEDRHGYLGNLGYAVSLEPRGCRLDVVGKGTPAYLAGLRAGDVLTHFAGQEVQGYADLHKLLEKTHPGQKVALAYQRAGQSSEATCQLARRPVEVIRPEYGQTPLRSHGDDPVDGRSLALSLSTLGSDKFDVNAEQPEELVQALSQANWKYDSDQSTPNKAIFTYELPQRLRLIKSFELPQSTAPGSMLDPSYHVQVTLRFENLSQASLPLSYVLDGPSGLPIEGWWYAQKVSPYFFRMAGMRDLWVRFTAGQPTLYLLSEALKDPKFSWPGTSPLQFIGVDAQYFAAVLIPQPTDPTETWFAHVAPRVLGKVPEDAGRKKLANLSFRLESKPVTLAANGGSLEHQFQLFLGPKKPDLLRQYKQASGDLSNLMYYGWFGWVSRPMLALLHFFYFLVGNHALSILLLTASVKFLLLPITRDQVRMSKKMQLLQPEMMALAKKFAPEDWMAKQQAQSALLKKHGINQMGGCLPALVQIPVFVGLYKALMVDVDLRQSPLISQAIPWCTNLAAPDQMFFWKPYIWGALGEETGWLGPFFNLLPVVAVATFYLQNKLLMPPAMDEQQQATQNTMSFMTIIMGVFFFRTASGLCLYMILQALWSLGERKLLANNVELKEITVLPNAPPKQKSTLTKWIERIQAAADEPPPEKKRPKQGGKRK